MALEGPLRGAGRVELIDRSIGVARKAMSFEVRRGA